MLKFVRKTLLWIALMPYAVYGLGAASNQLVLYVNDGKFPVMVTQKWLEYNNQTVDENGMLDPIHCLMTKNTHLNLLADIINFHDRILSVGDLLLCAGRDMMSTFVIIWITLLSEKVARKCQEND